MTHASLFSGIGGPDLAAEWMGWKNIFHCEINPFGRKVLNYYWPESKSYEDITKTDFSIHRGTIDVLTGGFPCQPYSAAGKRLGKEDDRHLWPEMLRAIREIQPAWVVGENVLGLVNWNGGLVFDEVQADLEAEGYEVQPYVLPACAVNAPHRRDRVWFVAYGQKHQQREQAERGVWPELRSIPETGQNAANPERIRQQGQGRPIHPFCSKKNGDWKASWADNDGRWPIEPPLCNGNDGFPFRLDGITLSKWREETIKAGGNGIVPQVIHQIFKAIQSYEMQKDFYQ